MPATAPDLHESMTMQQVLELFPGAQRALFRRYHIGGCSSCAFQAGETLAELCRRNENLDVTEVISHLRTSQAQDDALQMSPPEVAALQAAGKVKLLDVRTREEWDAVRIPGATRMSQDTMQEILSRWSRDELVVVYDHCGRQSLDAAAYFAGQGFKNVRCLRGGIDAWSAEVDSSLPRYTLEQAS